MADIRTVKVCDDTCGCAVPCPGGASCRCATAAATTTAAIGGGGEVRHNLCSCGQHCGCNPCTCGRNVSSMGVGRSACTCGTGCTCAACAAA